MFCDITLIGVSKRYLDFVNNFLFWFGESTMGELLFSSHQLLSHCSQTMHSKFSYLYAFSGPCEASRQEQWLVCFSFESSIPHFHRSWRVVFTNIALIFNLHWEIINLY
jgi:hypothetical protein